MRIGVDIGGTFTDFVAADEGATPLSSFKLLSTPEAPEQAVLEGISRLNPGAQTQIVHGSTVATNALLERRGARTAFVTTEGFRDLLAIGRQDRESLYDFWADRPAPLVPPEGCFEVAERVGQAGEILVPLQEGSLTELKRHLAHYGAESIAVCLLFSFQHPQHEIEVAEALEHAGVPVSLSSQILPRYREYERASTTVINAYVAPVVEHYLEALAGGLPEVQLRVMGSNGGSMHVNEARVRAARAVLSGPAGGVIGALHLSRLAGSDQVITLDMGGTSTDVSLARGAPQISTEWEVDGLPLHLPVIDIHTIGAGGGSIAQADTGGALRVGPASAGADPGPCCYARGGSLPTVTDANLVLGRLDPHSFLGGELPLDAQASVEALDRLGAELGLQEAAGVARAQAAALGVIRVVDAHMLRALRVISVARGYDPRDFMLTSYGGAGGLHASALARGLGIRRLLIPTLASTLSAFGMLAAEVMKDYLQTVMLPAEVGYSAIAGRMRRLESSARADLSGQGLRRDQISIVRELDLRYRGQSYELTVPFGTDFEQAFHRAHKHAYGYSDPETPVEVVNLRLQGLGATTPPELPTLPPGDQKPERALVDRRPVVLEGAESRRARQLPFYDGLKLLPGDHLQGPALIGLPDTSILLRDGDSCKLDGVRNFLIEVGVDGVA